MQGNEGSPPETPRRVVWSVTPDQSKSPYVTNIVGELEDQGWTVDSLSLNDIARTTGQVIHIQWPEHVSRGGGPAKTAAKHLRALALLAALRGRNHHVVLTAHNLVPHGETDPFDDWFRDQIYKIADVLIVLVPAHVDELNQRGQIHRTQRVVAMNHPAVPPKAVPAPANATPATHLLILGLIHPYHRIKEFVEALIAVGNTRPVEIAGTVGDDTLVDDLFKLAATHDWLTVTPGYVSDDDLVPILARTAAVVSLQKTPFNSGAPYFALPHNLPVMMTASSQAKYLAGEVGSEWIFEVPTNERLLDLDALDAWIDLARDTPRLDGLVTSAIAEEHAAVYQLLLTSE